MSYEQLKNLTEELFVGLDIHKAFTVAHILNQFGQKVMVKMIRGHWSNIFLFLDTLPAMLHVCYEANNGYGYLYDNISKRAKSVQVAHPGQCRLIFKSKKKTDRIDAEKLAKLLFLNEVPSIHVPEIKIRDWRRLITFRQHLVAEGTRVKNRIRALLRRYGIKAVTGLWSQKGLAWLESLTFETPAVKVELNILLDNLERQKAHLTEVEAHLQKIADHHPGVSLLMTIPGIGIRTAEAVVAWVDQPARFSRNHQIGSYFGFIPSEDSSGGVIRMGRITRQGPAIIRKLLCEAAWRCIRLSPEIRVFFEKVQRNDRDRKKIAIVATGHYLARVMLAMLKQNKPWLPKQVVAKAA